MCLKRIFFIIMTFSGGFLSAQNQLDDVHFNLPQIANWDTKPVRYTKDSMQRIQAWFKKDERGKSTLAVIIASRDKDLITTDFKGAQQETINDLKFGEEVSLLTEKQLENKYPFALYKLILQEKEKGKPGAYLMAMLETVNSIHTIYVRKIDLVLSKQFIATWSEVLENPIIENSKTKASQKTNITLSTTLPNELQNDKVRAQLIKRFQARLGTHFMNKEDLEIKEEKIILELRGKLESDRVREILSKNNSFQLLPLFRGDKYTSFVKSVNELLASESDDSNRKTDSRLAYFARLTKEDKIVSKIQQLVAKQDFPKGITLQTGPEMGSEAMLLYLVDTRNAIVDHSNIVAIKSSFNSRNFPSLQITFNEEGKEKIALWTQKHSSQYVAFSINDKIWSAPFVSQTILGGQLQITGGFTVENTEKMKDLLNGTYPIPICIEGVSVAWE